MLNLDEMVAKKTTQISFVMSQKFSDIMSFYSLPKEDFLKDKLLFPVDLFTLYTTPTRSL